MSQDVSEELAAKPHRTFFGHPWGPATLFTTEMWERFSYYGMRALLVLYLTATPAEGGLGYSTSTATAIYSVYVSMVYLLTLPGGWVADRIWGPKKTVATTAGADLNSTGFVAVEVAVAVLAGVAILLNRRKIRHYLGEVR